MNASEIAALLSQAYIAEGLRLLEENVAPAHAVDRVLRDAVGFAQGPLETLDAVGLDHYLAAAESLYRSRFEEARHRPSSLLPQRLAAGLLGRDQGEGFYQYREGVICGPVEALHEEAPPPLNLVTLPPLWVSQAHPEFGKTVSDLLVRLGGRIESGLRPGSEALCVVTPRGLDATTCASREGLDPYRTVAIDVVFGLGAGLRRTLMTTPVTSLATRRAAHALFAADGSRVSLIRDSAGFVAQRVVAHLVNIASDLAQRGGASAKEIDQAASQGLRHPKGPLALGDSIGSKRVLDILDSLYSVYRDPRYRPSPWLRRRALLGVSLLTPEG